MLEATLSTQMATFASRLTFDDLSAEHVRNIKFYLLDWLGSGYGGKNERPTKIMLELVRSLGGKPESTVLADGSKTMCLLAGLVNGASSHVLEMDDLHRKSIFHPACAITPATLAIAEREGASGKDLLLAISIGYEVGIRVALGVGPSHYQFWHMTATCGTFGAAAGAAKILGLDEEQFAWAMGSAGTQASGLWEFLVDSAMSKQLHPGKAALNGLLAALLAKGGFTGARKILEGERGFFRATSKDFDEERCLHNLGEEFFSETNSLKYYASCGHTHSAIEAILKATKSEPMTPDKIKQVDVSIYQASLDLLENIEPKTPYLAKFSLPFCIATALRYGHVNLDDFAEQRLNDPELHLIMERINLQSDPELTKSYPNKWPAQVKIHTTGGECLEASCDYPKGDPENPLAEHEVTAKFKSLTKGILPESQADRIVERIMNLENMDNVAKLL
jgi:2-methylcitrate dehydratase PrpD